VDLRGRRFAGADGRELTLHRVDGFVHRLLRLLDVVREGGGSAHCTIVPTRSPDSTLAVAPGWLMLNTTMGSLFSLHNPKALASITARSEERRVGKEGRSRWSEDEESKNVMIQVDMDCTVILIRE